MCGQPRFVALYLLSTECSSYKDQRLMPTEMKRQVTWSRRRVMCVTSVGVQPPAATPCIVGWQAN